MPEVQAVLDHHFLKSKGSFTRWQTQSARYILLAAK